jgi:hypothetical protein
MKKILTLIFCICLIFSLFGVVFGQMKPENFTKKIASIGYQLKSSENKTISDWEKNQFQMLSKTVYKIKRRTALKAGQSKMYPRFDISQEVYANEALAKLRATRISAKPPDLPIEQREYWMVSGFRHKNIVYFISTDAIIFYEMMGEFVKKFEKAVK